MRKKQQVQTTGEALEKPESQIRVMWDTLKKNKAAVAGLVVILFFLFLAVMGDWLAPYDPEYSDMGHTFVAPCRDYYFGTDQLGRDIFSRVLSGTKISLFVGVAAVAYSLLIGTVLGSVAGYFGGKVDSFIMRCMDIMLSIPSILLAITLMAARVLCEAPFCLSRKMIMWRQPRLWETLTGGSFSTTSFLTWSAPLW